MHIQMPVVLQFHVAAQVEVVWSNLLTPLLVGVYI